MALSFSNLFLQWLPHPRGPMMLYATIWTAFLTATVAVASFSAEVAYIWSVSPRSTLSKACHGDGRFIRLPLDVPTEVFCFPARLFKWSGVDVVVPTLFAAITVLGSYCIVKAAGLWESDQEEEGF